MKYNRQWLIALEPRLMFDGAALATTADALTDSSSATASHDDAAAAPADATDTQATDTPAASSPADRKEVAFIDASLSDAQTLAASLRAGVEIVYIQAGQNALDVMAEWASTHSGYDAIHILTHGSDGTLILGGTSLTRASLNDTAIRDKLAALGASLTADGDLMLYGCDLAASQAGQDFIAALSTITGADVAASDDATGAARLGGDWALEVTTGRIETAALDAPAFDSLLTSIAGMSVTVYDASDLNTPFETKTIDGTVEFTFSDSYTYTFDFDPNSGRIIITIPNTSGSGFLSSSFAFKVTNGSGNDPVFTSVSFNSGASTTPNYNTNLTVTYSTNTIIFTVNNIQVASTGEVLIYDFTVGSTGPTVTDGNISITSTGSGASGAYKVGDTVTAKWNNTSGGDNQSNISGVTMDFSAFGGGTAVSATNDGSGNWTASYVITAGTIDAANLNVSVKATDSVGTTTTADSTNLTVDNQAPTVTDAQVSITSTGSGTGGAYKTGDTVTVSWNNTGSGDNNADTISSVTADFSAFGGGSAVTATNNSGTWTASYVITAGSIDTTGLNVSITATDNAGNTTTRADTTGLSVDNQAPTATDANISISGATGAGGVYKVGDTVTATWNNTGAGDNNADTISGVTFNFSAFGGGTAVSATDNGSGTWTATYVITAGSISASSLNVSATVTDNAGNTTTRADTTNATVDNQRPAVTSVSVPANSTYGTGQNLDFTVNFGENVTVDTTGGTPRIALTIGSTTKYATYVSGSGTSALVFRYTVDADLSDTDGIAVGALSVNGGSLKDSVGNDATVTLNNVGSLSSVLVDSAGPTLSSSTPADNATGVSPSANIVLNFNENITKGTGNIVIKRTSDNSVIETIAVGDAKVSVSGAQVTINPDATLADSTEYYVQIDSGAFTDSLSNAYAGISSTTALSFTTTDSAPPLLSSTSPVDNATSVASSADIVLTFNESVAKGTGNIVIKKTSDNSTVATIDVTSGQVTVTGSQVTINPTSDLAFGTEYYVQIDSGAIKDASNNNYAGISDTTSLSFTTGGPSITGVTGVNGSYKAGDNVDITLTFNGAVDVTGTPTLTLANGATATYVSGSGTTGLVFRYTVAAGNTSADLDYASTSALSLAGGTIIANGGSVAAVLTLPTPGAAGSLGSNQNIVIDTTAPTIASIDRQTPASGTTNADSLVYRVTFAETVTNVDAADFTVTGTTGTVTNVASAGGNAYDITISGGDLANLNGTVTLGFAGGQNIADSAGNALAVTTPTGTNNAVYTLDNTAPTVTSIVRQTPSSSPTNATSVVYRVTFGEGVSNVDAADFSVSGTTGTVSNVVSAGGNSYDVTISGGNLATLDGTITLSFAGGQNITDSAGNALAATTPTGTNDAGFVMDHTAPTAPTLAATGGGDSTSATITGTAEANATVKIYNGDTLLGTVTADGTGAYTYTATLSVGSHTLKAKAQDAAGNESGYSTTGSVTVNAPVATVSAPASTPTPTADPTPTSPAAPPTTDTGTGSNAVLVTTVRDTAVSDKPADIQTVVRTVSLPTTMVTTTSVVSSLMGSGSTSGGGLGGGNLGVGGFVSALGDTRTQGGGNAFQVALAGRAPGGGDALVINTRVPDASFDVGSRISVTVPGDAFAHTRADASVTLTAKAANGAALPSWMTFNPRTGTFEGTPPPGFRGEVQVRVTARDNDGREVVQSFKIQVGVGQGNAAPGGRTGALDGGPDKLADKPVGRPSLTQQLRDFSKDGQQAKQAALFGLKPTKVA